MMLLLVVVSLLATGIEGACPIGMGSLLTTDENGSLWVCPANNTVVVGGSLENAAQQQTIAGLHARLAQAMADLAALRSQAAAAEARAAAASEAVSSLCFPAPGFPAARGPFVLPTGMPIGTTGARDWEFFTIGNWSYLALANGFDDDRNTTPNSTIYRFSSNTMPESLFSLDKARKAWRAIDVITDPPSSFRLMKL
jgi:hypothetical protein